MAEGGSDLPFTKEEQRIILQSIKDIKAVDHKRIITWNEIASIFNAKTNKNCSGMQMRRVYYAVKRTTLHKMAIVCEKAKGGSAGLDDNEHIVFRLLVENAMFPQRKEPIDPKLSNLHENAIADQSLGIVDLSFGKNWCKAYRRNNSRCQEDKKKEKEQKEFYMEILPDERAQRRSAYQMDIERQKSEFYRTMKDFQDSMD